MVRNELFPDAQGTPDAGKKDEVEEIATALVIRAIGYQFKPLPDIPFDADRGVIANKNGRVVNQEKRAICPGEYVTGWAKRGPVGVIGTNKPDAYETVDLLLDDFLNRTSDALSEPQAQRITRFLESKKLAYVPFEDWKILDQAEIDEGRKTDRPREKITTVEEMLNVIKQAY